VCFLYQKPLAGIFQFTFPPKLKRFLQTQLPISDHFVNWRQGVVDKKMEERISDIIGWPFEGILWDIKNDAWLNIWGERPENINDWITLARSHFATVPKMVPIYSHRFMPSEPNQV